MISDYLHPVWFCSHARVSHIQSSLVSVSAVLKVLCKIIYFGQTLSLPLSCTELRILCKVTVCNVCFVKVPPNPALDEAADALIRAWELYGSDRLRQFVIVHLFVFVCLFVCLFSVCS